MPFQKTSILACVKQDRSEKVRERLTRLISWTGITQTEIAKRVKKSDDWVSRRLTGDGSIFSDEIEDFATALRVPPCALVDDAELERVTSEWDPPGARPQSRRREIPDQFRHGWDKPSLAPDDPQLNQEAAIVLGELKDAWPNLPEAERDFLKDIAEARRRYRERVEGGPK